MTSLAPPATIAFIGLGMMGRPMASRLAEAGYKLRLFDISQKAVSDFVGAHLCRVALAVKDDEALDALDVGGFGTDAIMLQAQGAPDLFEQPRLFRHEATSADKV